MKTLIRQASAADFPSILEIYREGTADDRSYDYPCQDVSYQARKEWFEAHRGRFPILVYEHQNEILGFLSLNPFDSREFMQHIAEASIYVKRSARGGGIGTALWRYTFACAHRMGFKKIIAVCFPNNPALKLKQKMGFKIIGTYQHHVHRGGGTYYDLHILEKYLD